jgi:hypothetical protein
MMGVNVGTLVSMMNCNRQTIKHHNPYSIQHAYLVARTYTIPVIKIQTSRTIKIIKFRPNKTHTAVSSMQNIK